MPWDYLIVGAGFAGAVLAERLASQRGATCLVIDRRDHIGGNAHDHYDKAGVLLHTPGPLYFRTNSDRIVRPKPQPVHRMASGRIQNPLPGPTGATGSSQST